MPARDRTARIVTRHRAVRHHIHREIPPVAAATLPLVPSSPAQSVRYPDPASPGPLDGLNRCSQTISFRLAVWDARCWTFRRRSAGGGTPLFMALEIWRLGPLCPNTDLRESRTCFG